MELVVIRRVILGVLLFGMTGLLVELWLLGHYEDFKQWIPLGLMTAGIMTVLAQLAYPRVWTLRLVQMTMVLFIAGGLLGILFHYQGSREFQLEMDASMSGTTLLWRVLQAKSPPTLSPGMMVQFGILGLGYAYLRSSK